MSATFDLFGRTDTPAPRASRSVPASSPVTVCCMCGSEDWIRCTPGQDAYATSLSAAQLRGNVAVLPGVAVPSVAFCRTCDPILVRGGAEPVSVADLEYRSWGA